ncbi:MAG: sugar isomerase domain-containing protein [Opitutales bacterium]
MTSLASSYFDAVTALQVRARDTNAAVIATCAAVIGESIAREGVLHTFGSGHSDVIAREIVGRAGGLACVSSLIDPTGGFIENMVGYGTTLAERYDRQHGLRAGEVIIVISNSGKNSAPIEVALYAKAKGLTVIGLTSRQMSSTSPTVHPGGRKLHEIADHVLDNLGVPGDTLIDTGGGLMSGPTSTLIGALLLNLLMLEVIAWLKAHGHPLPVLRSQNIPGTIEHNRQVGAKYLHRLSRLLT